MLPDVFEDLRDLKLITVEGDDPHRFTNLLIFERIALVDFVPGLVYG